MCRESYFHLRGLEGTWCGEPGVYLGWDMETCVALGELAGSKPIIDLGVQLSRSF